MCVLGVLPEWLLVALFSFLACYKLFSAWADKALAAWELVVLAGLGLGFGALAIRLSGTVWFFLFFFGGIAALIGVFGLFAVLTYRSPRQRAQQLDLLLYRQAAHGAPDNAEAQARLAQSYMKAGSLVQAIEHYQKAVELEPERLAEQNMLTYALQEKARREQQDLCPNCLKPLNGALRCRGCGWRTPRRGTRCRSGQSSCAGATPVSQWPRAEWRRRDGGRLDKITLPVACASYLGGLSLVCWLGGIEPAAV